MFLLYLKIRSNNQERWFLRCKFICAVSVFYSISYGIKKERSLIRPLVVWGHHCQLGLSLFLSYWLSIEFFLHYWVNQCILFYIVPSSLPMRLPYSKMITLIIKSFFFLLQFYELSKCETKKIKQLQILLSINVKNQ